MKNAPAIRATPIPNVPRESPPRSQRLKNQNEMPVKWIAPATISDGQILRAHAPEMLARLKIPHDFDNDTPFFENISDYRPRIRRRRA